MAYPWGGIPDCVWSSSAYVAEESYGDLAPGFERGEH